MGRWNETCAVTGLPIREGTPVLMIVPVMGDGSWRQPTMFPFVATSVSFVGRGKYDGCGGIIEHEEDEDSTAHLRSIFVRLDVWDRVLPLMTEDVDDILALDEVILGKACSEDEVAAHSRNIDGVRDVIALLMFCSMTRIDPQRGILFKGSQADLIEPYHFLSFIISDIVLDISPSILEVDGEPQDPEPMTTGT